MARRQARAATNVENPHGTVDTHGVEVPLEHPREHRGRAPGLESRDERVECGLVELISPAERVERAHCRHSWGDHEHTGVAAR
jgi:hypothetical protein